MTGVQHFSGTPRDRQTYTASSLLLELLKAADTAIALSSYFNPGLRDRVVGIEAEINAWRDRMVEYPRHVDDAASMLAMTLRQVLSGDNRAEVNRRWVAIARELRELVKEKYAAAFEREMRPTP